MKFKPVTEEVTTDSPYYDLFDGGYIKPELMLASERDVDKVYDAMYTIQQFLEEAEEAGHLVVN